MRVLCASVGLMGCQDRLIDLHKALFADSSPSPTKFALAQLRLCSEDVRLPLAPCSEAARRIVCSSPTSISMPTGSNRTRCLSSAIPTNHPPQWTAPAEPAREGRSLGPDPPAHLRTRPGAQALAGAGRPAGPCLL